MTCIVIATYRCGWRSWEPCIATSLGRPFGLSRVRAMTLNDAHIFCLPEQIQAEAVGVLRLIERVYRISASRIIGISSRSAIPRTKSTSSIMTPCGTEPRASPPGSQRSRGAYKEAIGEAAYYGPKIDVQLNDVLGHSETRPTVHWIFIFPSDSNWNMLIRDGQYKRPVMIHRGVISTMERMMAFLIEHYAGNFPLWLAPVQLKVVTVTDQQLEYARKSTVS